MADPGWLPEPVRAIHEEIRSVVVHACERSAQKQLSEIAEDGAGDTIYAIDRISDSLLTRLFEERVASREPIVLVAEGLPDGKITLPRGAHEREAVWRVLADPIDGTRCPDVSEAQWLDIDGYCPKPRGRDGPRGHRAGRADRDPPD